MSDAIDHLARAPGHCGHAPKCLRIGETDERDPLGCCRCGQRVAELSPRLLAVAKAALNTLSQESWDENDLADTVDALRVVVAEAEGRS